MVASLPPPQAVAANLNGLSPTSPSRQNMFRPNNLPQPISSALSISESRLQHRLPDDYRSNGFPAFSNGEVALPVSGGPPPQHPQVTNGGLRHRAATGGGVFDGPRSPPSTKSKSPSTKDARPKDRLIVPVQIRRTCRASFSDRDNVRPEKLAPSPTPPTSPPPTPRANISPR